MVFGFVLALFAESGITSGKAGELISGTSSDSLSGWTPLQGEQDEALAVAMSFLRTIDQGSYAEAYTMLAGSMKALASEGAFEAGERAFNMKAGPVIERRPTAITWTNHAGIFAAIDFVVRYKNIDRACGYVILVKMDDGSGMRVLRIQMASLDNATALNIAAKQSPGAVDQVWHALARQYPHCQT